MFLPEEAIERIRVAISQRIPTMPSCWMCSHTAWRLTDGFSSVDVSKDLRTFAERRRIAVAVYCGHCGNIVLLDLEALGLNDLIEEFGSGQVTEDDLDV